jgi:16S rRNA processing protein RimM
VEFDELALVGQVARPHGLRGQVIVNVETDFPKERFVAGAELFVLRGRQIETVMIETVRFKDGRPIIGFKGIESIEGAETLAGTELRIPREQLSALPQNVFYRHDLVGCRVEREDGSVVGVVTDVEIESGGNRLVVEVAGEPVLVPLASEICLSIDVAHRRIVIRPPEGLLELNARP